MSDFRNFVFEAPQERFPFLVNIFYSNIKYSNRYISSEVKNHHIQLSLEEFAKVFNVLYKNQVYNETELSNNFRFDLVANSFFADQTSIILTPFIVGLICPNIRVIHYKVNHILFLNKNQLRPYTHIGHTSGLVFGKQS